MKCLLLLCTIGCILRYAYAQNKSCETPNQEPGECVVIHNCLQLLSLIKRHPLTSYKSETAVYIRNAICGFEGVNAKVCCALSREEIKSNILTGSLTKLPDSERPESIGPINTKLLPSPEECGPANEFRIGGGNNTEVGEFPWAVLIDYQTPTHRGFFCGGILISKRYVLTAAHCVVENIKYKIVSVRLGEFDTERDPDCENDYCAEPIINIPVERQIVHERYDPDDVNHHHDIALLRLMKDVSFSDYIKPICLPTTDELLRKSFTNEIMTVCGWGRTETRSESNIKQKLEVSVKSYSECASLYSSQRVNFTAGQLCAGGVKGKDSCQGDSGGPLMTLHQSNTGVNWYVTGIVSFGPEQCGLEGWPSIYTRVTEYVPWIVSKLKP